MNSLAERIAVITGGGRGIGRAVALAFAREGADVMVLARTEDEVRRVAEEVRGECGVRASHAVCDVSDAASVERAFALVLERFGRAADI
ncbi:MAG TPA: SDR family NAD(P)-dependent oxidoreductase, partial [Pyrinomonadaceae bacterium]|nr:SDR family NAD(P)-dependent oxidoreductase [Pyrinomonadaceae bacterium]